MYIFTNLFNSALRQINFGTLSAGFLGTLIAAWVLSNDALFTIGLFVIGLLLLGGGWWYAKEIYKRPIKPTFKSVMLGNLIFGAGITAVGSLINITGMSLWLHPFMWLWCLALCGGPQIYWQQLKEDEQKPNNNKASKAFRSELED